MVPISSSADVKVICTTLTKVCVPIFAVMSGYGINCSWNNCNCGKLKFVFAHIQKLLINYWMVYIPAFMLSTWLHIEGTPYNIYGGGIKGMFYCILDFIGLRTTRYPSLCNTWWFIETVFICYLLFPIINKGLNKIPIITFIICAIPCVLANFDSFSTLLGGTDRELFYLFSFAVGVYLSKRNIFLIHSFVYFYFTIVANIVWYFDNAIWKFMSCFRFSLLFSVCLEKIKEKTLCIKCLK